MNFIHPTACIPYDLEIGDGNYIGPYVVIGESPQHKEFKNSIQGKIKIGDNNVFRAFCTVDRPTTGITSIGSNCFIMAGCHISHDTIIEDDVTMANNVLFGGHSYIMRGVNIGLGVIAHQRSLIGSFSMIGMGTVITKNTKIVPGNVYAGSPARFLKQNAIGLERAKISKNELLKEMERWGTIKC